MILAVVMSSNCEKGFTTSGSCEEGAVLLNKKRVLSDIHYYYYYFTLGSI